MSRRSDWLQAAVLCDRLPRVGAIIARRLSEGGEFKQGLAGGLVSRVDRARAQALLRSWPPDRLLDAAHAAGCRVATALDADYPGRLLDLEVPPPALFWRGTGVAWGDEMLAIVGSRNASRSGCRLAHSFARAAVEAGAGVVSGMAFGIDAAAHIGALDGGGKTVAVLAGGPDQASPRGMAHVYERILDSGGAIVSEYPPGSAPKPYRFPVRNRIISGLGHRLLVVEAGVRSGSLHTVDHALAMGRSVFSVPADAGKETGRGSNQLIRDGALVALDPADLFPDWETRTAPGIALGMEDRKVLGVLRSGACPVNEVADRAGLPIAVALSAMGRLEANGLIEVRAGWAETVTGFRSVVHQGL